MPVAFKSSTIAAYDDPLASRCSMIGSSKRTRAVTVARGSASANARRNCSTNWSGRMGRVPGSAGKQMPLSTLKTKARQCRAGGAAPGYGRGGLCPPGRVEAAVRPWEDWTGNPAGVPRPRGTLIPARQGGDQCFFGAYFSTTRLAWGTDVIRMSVTCTTSRRCEMLRRLIVSKM